MYPWPLIEHPEPRRLAVLRAAPEVVVGLLHYLNQDDRRITQAGLPADAKVVTADYDFDRRCFRMLLESEEFQLVAHGTYPPDLWVTFTERRLPEASPTEEVPLPA